MTYKMEARERERERDLEFILGEEVEDGIDEGVCGVVLEGLDGIKIHVFVKLQNIRVAHHLTHSDGGLREGLRRGLLTLEGLEVLQAEGVRVASITVL